MTAPIEYHLHAMQSVLGAPPFGGRILDAGCGEGIDLASVSLSGPVTAVGVELSHGGIAATSARIEGLSRARLIQGNVLSLPFADGVFDGAYSYGVVHHTIDPEGAVREIARVLKPGAMLLLYVYEDFSSRSIVWRTALAATNAFRQSVSAMSPANIRRFCRPDRAARLRHLHVAVETFRVCAALAVSRNPEPDVEKPGSGSLRSVCRADRKALFGERRQSACRTSRLPRASIGVPARLGGLGRRRS